VNRDALSLFGFPVVITEDAPQGEILFGPILTWKDLIEHGSLEAAIEARKTEWAKIVNIETDNE